MASRISTLIPLLLTGLILTCACGAPPESGDTVFRYRLPSDPPSLDPIHTTDTTSATIVMNVFEGLVDQDPLTLEIVPALAESWEVTDDALSYTFHLKHGVTFHNGRKVTSEDFRYNFERCLTAKNRSERSWVLQPIKGAKAMLAGDATTLEGMETPDDYTVILHLEEPYAPFLSYLAMEAGRIAAKEGVDGDEFTPIGTGPFKFLTWDHGIRVSVEANEAWHGGDVGLPLIEFEIIPDVGVAYQKFIAGELDFVDELPPGQIERIKERNPESVQMWPYVRVEYIGFNHTRPPFKNNVTLRKALSHAVDRKSIVESLFEGAAEIPTGILPPDIPGRNESIEGYSYDPELAKNLLAESGYPGGSGLPEITLWYNTNERHEQIMQFIQSNLNDIGVKARLRSLDWPAYLKACESHEPDIYRLGWVADIPDADNFLYILLHSSQKGSAGNYSGYSNQEFDQLVSEARRIPDQAKRNELYMKAEKIAMDDAVWILYAYPMQQALFNPEYEGLVYAKQGDFRIPLHLLNKKSD